MNNAEFQKSLEKYADVIVKIGVNLRAGQRLFIAAGITDYPLVRAITKSAYTNGAKLVHVFYGDDEVHHTRMKMSSRENLTDVPSWIVPAYTSIIKDGDAYIGITSENPDLLADVDPDREEGQVIMHQLVRDLLPRSRLGEESLPKNVH